ncbi:MAG: radical SAM protein [Deltaproteobacteria bacterium]|nr:radical SAM protein [Deltaproteobacteria bacterium]
MSWKIKKYHQELREAEQGRLSHVWSRQLNIALVYPNLYYFGMSNLGFQSLYCVFNSDEHHCERFFLPDAIQWQDYRQSGTTLLSVDSDTPATEFDLIAFSISYQNDVLNFLAILELMKFPLRADQRGEEFPIILVGGPAMTINPLPLAPFLDVAVIGEGEEVGREITEILKLSLSKQEKLEALAKLEGVFVPQIHSDVETRKVQRRIVNQLQPPLAHSKILTPHTEFGDLFLIEVQRGCQWACRFCAAGYIYRYPRYSQIETLKRRVDLGFQYRQKMGLIAGDLLGYENLIELLQYIDEKGGGFSPSSVRLNAFTPEVIHYLKKSGNRTIAIAPEAGSQRLRRQLNKTFTQEEIINAAVMLAEGGIHNIKLYIMMGLPDEKEEDIEELCALTQETRNALLTSAKKSGVIPKLTLSLSPFTPKPATPFQREAYEGREPLKEKLRKIETKLLPVGNIHITGETNLDAYVETLLSRGDERVSQFVMNYHQKGRKLKKALKDLDFDPDFFVTRRFEPNERLPWDFIDHGVKPNYLQKERERGEKGVIIPKCEPVRCHICGIC